MASSENAHDHTAQDRTALRERIAALHDRVTAAARKAGRDPGEVTLVGIAKTKPAALVREAHAAGLHDVGESYVDEFFGKEAEFHPPDLRYHFVGRLPRKRVRKVVGRRRRNLRTALIHSVDSLKLAHKISFVAGSEGVTQPLLVQVNQGGEPTKSGVAPEAAVALLRRIAELPAVELRGLMTLPPLDEPARPYFRALRELRDRARDELGLPLPDLSMGLTGDFVEAIAEGATLVRVGTALFGARACARLS